MDLIFRILRECHRFNVASLFIPLKNRRAEVQAGLTIIAFTHINDRNSAHFDLFRFHSIYSPYVNPVSSSESLSPQPSFRQTRQRLLEHIWH